VIVFLLLELSQNFTGVAGVNLINSKTKYLKKIFPEKNYIFPALTARGVLNTHVMAIVWKNKREDCLEK